MGIFGGRFRRAFSIKSSVLSEKIVACQESFFVVRLLVSSAQPQRRRRRENISKTKNPERAAHFLAGFFAVIARRTLSNLIEMAMQSPNDV